MEHSLTSPGRQKPPRRTWTPERPMEYWIRWFHSVIYETERFIKHEVFHSLQSLSSCRNSIEFHQLVLKFPFAICSSSLSYHLHLTVPSTTDIYNWMLAAPQEVVVLQHSGIHEKVGINYILTTWKASGSRQKLISKTSGGKSCSHGLKGLASLAVLTVYIH